MSKLNSNKKRYLELLKIKRYSQDKVLISIEKSELSEDRGLLDGTLYWEAKEQYPELLEKFLSGKINLSTFFFEFKERTDSDGEVIESYVPEEKIDSYLA